MFNSQLKEQLHSLTIKYDRLLNEWNSLVNLINSKGGSDFLNSTPNQQQFTKLEIDILIRLCHPDKHDGKRSAVEITQKLIKLRDEL